MAETLHQPLVAVAEPVDLPYAVVVMEAQHDGADHVVDPRAEAAAGDDAAGNGYRVEKDLLPRPGELQRRRLHSCVQVRLYFLEPGVVQYPITLACEPPLPHGGGNAALAEPLDREVQVLVGHDGSLHSNQKTILSPSPSPSHHREGSFKSPLPPGERVRERG